MSMISPAARRTLKPTGDFWIADASHSLLLIRSRVSSGVRPLLAIGSALAAFAPGIPYTRDIDCRST